jgi:hypothetical protein
MYSNLGTCHIRFNLMVKDLGNNRIIKLNGEQNIYFLDKLTSLNREIILVGSEI